jgi:hypothetical protein
MANEMRLDSGRTWEECWDRLDDPRGTCVDCGGTRWVSVPHPKVVLRGRSDKGQLTHYPWRTSRP